MTWILLFVVLAFIAYIASNVKEAFSAFFNSDSIIVKLAAASLVSAIGAWIIHYFILNQLMLEISKFLAAFIFLLLISFIISLFSRK